MNKKVFSAGLCLSLVLGAYGIADASEADITSNTEMTAKNEENHNYIFKVTNVNDGKVTLCYDGEMTSNAYERDLTVSKELNLDKALFNEDVKAKDSYMVTSKKDVKDLKDEDLKKENISLSAGYEKPENMDFEKLPKDTSKIGLEVVEVGDGSATLVDMENPNMKYMASFDDLRDDNVKIGDTYTLYWDGVVMESNPAQFGKIYRVEEVTTNKEEDKDSKTTLEFEVVEKTDEGVTLAEVGNKDNLYNISLKDLRDDKPEIGDRYMITWNGISMKSYPAQFGEIYDVEKWMKKDTQNVSKDKLREAIKKADEVPIGDASYSKESVEAFGKAYNEAKMVNDKDEASQEKIDKAASELLAAIDGLSEKTGEIKKEFQLTQFIEKGGKKAELQSVDYPDKKFTTSIDSLNDKNAKVGDHYMVTISKVDPKAEPFEMGEITKIEKLATANTDKNNDKQNKQDNIVVNKEETPKENKQTNVLNPKTGVASVTPLLGVIAGGLALLRKKED